MTIKESGENYLEAILSMKRERGPIRAIDLAAHFGFSKPSVSVALKHFKEEGYVTVDDAGFISLTQKGSDIAERVYERHTTIAALLVSIGVERETALIDACKIEHDISQSTFERLKEVYARVKK
jgi:Mn-dependent DtxR family transcriptional regulator